ncbi:MAG: hypothetical protein ACYCQI_15370 [Gammaproteobacteria bacterium]
MILLNDWFQELLAIPSFIPLRAPTPLMSREERVQVYAYNTNVLTALLSTNNLTVLRQFVIHPNSQAFMQSSEYERLQFIINEYPEAQKIFMSKKLIEKAQQMMQEQDFTGARQCFEETTLQYTLNKMPQDYIPEQNAKKSINEPLLEAKAQDPTKSSLQVHNMFVASDKPSESVDLSPKGGLGRI